MSTPLTDRINSLTSRANAATGASDTTLSDAVETLIDGYGQGGQTSSSWQKIYETTVEVSTTSTSVATVATISTGHPEIWTSNKWLFVTVTDTAGKRPGYFYKSENLFFTVHPANGSQADSSTGFLRFVINYDAEGKFNNQPNQAYGVWPDTVYSNGDIRIRRRYGNTISLTIDGTYRIEVYVLNTANGLPVISQT